MQNKIKLTSQFKPFEHMNGKGLSHVFVLALSITNVCLHTMLHCLFPQDCTPEWCLK